MERRGIKASASNFNRHRRVITPSSINIKVQPGKSKNTGGARNKETQRVFAAAFARPLDFDQLNREVQ